MIRPKVLFIVMCLICLMALIMAIRQSSNNSNKTADLNQAGIASQAAYSPDTFSTPRFDTRFNPPRSGRAGTSGSEPPPLDASVSHANATNVVPNELIVTLKTGANIDAIAASVGAQVVGRIDKLSAYRLEFTDAVNAAAAREALAVNTDVESLDSNYSVGRLPGGDEISGNYESSAKLTVTPGDAGGKVVVGLIDTAVQIENSGLNEAFFLPSISVSAEPASDAGSLTHGTSMAEALLQGLSSIEIGNGETSVRILSVDVYGNSESTTTYEVTQGIIKAIENGATIINLSLGSEGDSDLLQQVIADAHAQGIIFFSAAGNSPVTTATYPAAYSEVVAVTATDSQGNIASYANHGDFVDIATPGTVIVTYNGKSYLVTGTSASTALASGAAAGLAEKTGASTAKVEETVRKGLAVP